MTMRQIFYKLILISVILGFTNRTNKTVVDSKDSLKQKNDKVIYESFRENLKFSVNDTVRISKSFTFSNVNSKDLFILTINPGLVKESKSSFQIRTSDGKIIYDETFDSFYFIRDIFEPSTVPTSGGQDAYDKYMREYWQSLTEKQYNECFNKNVQSFYKNISFINRNRLKEILAMGEVDKDNLNEIQADTTIRIINITCFGCDEGGSVVFYSPKKEKTVTLLDHD